MKIAARKMDDGRYEARVTCMGVSLYATGRTRHEAVRLAIAAVAWRVGWYSESWMMLVSAKGAK